MANNILGEQAKTSLIEKAQQELKMKLGKFGYRSFQLSNKKNQQKRQ